MRTGRGLRWSFGAAKFFCRQWQTLFVGWGNQVCIGWESNAYDQRLQDYWSECKRRDCNCPNTSCPIWCLEEFPRVSQFALWHLISLCFFLQGRVWHWESSRWGGACSPQRLSMLLPDFGQPPFARIGQGGDPQTFNLEKAKDETEGTNLNLGASLHFFLKSRKKNITKK